MVVVAVNGGASGSEIVLVATSRPLFIGLIFVIANVAIYLIVRNHKRARRVTGWILVIAYIAAPFLVIVYGLIASSRGGDYDKMYGQFTYEEVVGFVDNCQIDHIAAADDNVSEEGRDAWRRVYLKSGENKLFLTIDLSSIKADKGHLTCA